MSYNTFTPIVTDGLVLYLDAANTKSYPGTGTSWLDLSKNGNNGTLVGGPTFSSSNLGSIVLDGSDDFILPTNSFGGGNWSVSMWVNIVTPIVASPPYYNHYCLIEGESLTTFLAVTDSSINVYVTPIVNYSFVNNTGWHNICFTYSGTQITAAVDGVNRGVITITNPLSSNKIRRIGKRDAIDTTHPYKGNISNVQFYNRALSVSEVLQNYNATKFRYL
jgi:hypothetical protein